MQHFGDPARFLDDPEPAERSEPLIDAHVHVFPPRVFAAIWRWFDRHAWPVRYRLEAEQVCAFLRERGVRRFAALHYSHVPGMARALNGFVTELAERVPELVPFGTVLPGEPDAAAIVAESLDELGHAGLKIHCHVQRCAPDDPRLFPVYEAVAGRGRLLVMHAGREPASRAYGFDCRGLCGFAPVRRVVDRYPELKLIVPHLGADEWREFLALSRDTPNLHLDTAVAVGGYLSDDGPRREDLIAAADRLLFGSDFPNLPYPWGRERDWLIAQELPPAALAAILHDNAARLLDGAADPRGTGNTGPAPGVIPARAPAPERARCARPRGPGPPRRFRRRS